MNDETFITLLAILMLSLASLTGCGYDECRTNRRYADAPGICGKIYRTQQSKNLFNEKALPKVIGLLLVFFIPIWILILVRLSKAVWAVIIRLIHRT